MALVSFRPHILQLLQRSGGHYATAEEIAETGSNLKQGDWVQGEPERVVAQVPCRYEPNGRAREITLPDGKAYRYAYTLYLTVDPFFELKYGDLVRLISQDSKDMGVFEIKGFHRGQLDMKAWV